jgi:hypothetical protein
MEQTNFEKACAKLNISPAIPAMEGLQPSAAKRMIAEYQLDIIEQATNNGWKADFGNYLQKKWTCFMNWSPPSGCFVLDGTAYADTITNLGARFWFKDSESARRFYEENAALINELHSL